MIILIQNNDCYFLGFSRPTCFKKLSQFACFRLEMVAMVPLHKTIEVINNSLDAYVRVILFGT